MVLKRLGFKYKQPPPTLVVLHHDKPIAELAKVEHGYLFRYLPSFEEMGLSPLPGLPQEAGDNFFYELPTYFEERLPDMRRPEIREWMEQRNISADSKLQLLAALGSHTITDPFEFRLKDAA
jgi:HipA-like protein